MKKILYFIAQFIIGWIEYEKPYRLTEYYNTVKLNEKALECGVGYIVTCEEAISNMDTQPVKVRWTVDEIKPVRPTEYLDGKGSYWTLNTRTKDECGWAIDWLPFLSQTEWVVPVPDAPEELKPLAYPENKPKEDGWYLVHTKTTDSWYCWHYLTFELMWETEVDYFIDCQLESED